MITNCYKIHMDNDFKFNSTVEYLFSRIKGLTQKKVSEATGLKQPEVSMIKTGERKGTLHQQALLRDYFGMTKEEVGTLGNAIQAGIDPIGLPKVSFNQARLILQRFFDDSGIDSPNLTITFDQEGPPSLITGPQTDIEKHKTQKNQPHHDLVNEFEQPEEAYELNCILRKIEKLEKAKFKKIKKFLLAELEELEESKSKDNNQQDKDQKNETG